MENKKVCLKQMVWNHWGVLGVAVATVAVDGFIKS